MCLRKRDGEGRGQRERVAVISSSFVVGNYCCTGDDVDDIIETFPTLRQYEST
jgi:hypothetical protein